MKNPADGSLLYVNIRKKAVRKNYSLIKKIKDFFETIYLNE